MSKKIVGGIKDENGIYTPTKVLPTSSEPKETQVSIDDLLSECLLTLKKMVSDIKVEIGLGSPSRETVMNLKDVTSMLWDFKKKEQDFLNNLTDEQLEKLLKK